MTMVQVTVVCVGCDLDGLICWFFFFFFQAEDGIRDYKVTGVQTCALPISSRETQRRRLRGCACHGATDALISEPEPCHALRVVQVSSIDDQRARQGALDPLDRKSVV